MNLTIDGLMIVAQMSDGKKYFVLVKEETMVDILKLINQKEGKINVLDKEIEIIDFKNGTVNGKKL